MYWVIDFITGAEPDKPRMQQDWQTQLSRLPENPGFLHAELFEKHVSIKNADYDFVAVYVWDALESLEAARKTGILDCAASDVKVERSVCQVQIALSELQESAPGNVWLINPFEVNASQIPGVLDMWDKAKDYMVQKDGFFNARLFRNIDVDAHYGLINIAHWKSAELFMTALNNNSYDKHRQKSEAYLLHPSLCHRVGVLQPHREQALV